MTDIISTAPVTFRHPVLSSLRLPKVGVGRAFVWIVEEFTHALNLAYAQPYGIDRGQLPIILEGSEKGRDPSW